MLLPLRKTIYAATVCIAVVSIALVLFGLRQYLLHRHYEKVISQSEALLFQFSTVQGHIAESLLEGGALQTDRLIDEVKGLNSDVSEILEDVLIPDEYKLAFVNQVDLAGITLMLRGIKPPSNQPDKLRQLNREMRILSDRLLHFDRIVARHAQAQLLGFQSVVIGTLAIVVFVVIGTLLFLHRQVAAPFLQLLRQAREATLDKGREVMVGDGCSELAELGRCFNHLLSSRLSAANELARKGRILSTLDTVTLALDRCRSRQALFAEVCRALLSHGDYCLVWIGVPSTDGEELVPVAAEASNAMGEKELKGCMAALLGAAKEKGLDHDQAAQALRTAGPTVVRDILRDIPRGPFKDTPLAEGLACCAVLPLGWAGTTYGVLNIYSTSPDCFGENEVQLLTGMTRNVALAISFEEQGLRLDQERHLNGQIVRTTHPMIMRISPAGRLLSFNPEAERVLGYSEGEALAKEWLQLLVPGEERASQAKVFSQLVEGSEAEQTAAIPFLRKDGERRYVCCRLARVANVEDRAADIRLIGRDVTEEDVYKRLAIRACRLASIGELATGVAYEINNLVNGIINCAQVLQDRAHEHQGEEGEIDLLSRIIKEGERTADIVGRLLVFSAERRARHGEQQMGAVVSRPLSLIEHQLEIDGIHVTRGFPDGLPPVRTDCEHMEQVFMHLLSNARYALNRRYPGKDANKRLEVRCEVVSVNGEGRLRTSLTDWGTGIDRKQMEKVFAPGFSTKPPGEGTGMGLNISRELVRAAGGELNVESILGDHTSVIVDLPIRTP